MDAIKYAEEKGVLFVISAGNEGKNVTDIPNFPMKFYMENGEKKFFSNMIVVGANSWMKKWSQEKDPENKNVKFDLSAPFSNFSKEAVDIFAPGVQINSTVPNNKYKKIDGTSMASPEVTGIAAILKSYFPNLTAQQLKEVIISSARQYPGLMVKVKDRSTKESFSNATNDRIQKRLDWIKDLNVIDEFRSVVNSNIERIKQTNEKYRERVVAKNVGNDARNIFTNSDLTTRMPDNSIPLIITSPPYGSAQKYIRSSSLSLNWLSFVPPKGLRSLEEKSIGREHLITELLCLEEGNLPKTYNNLIERIAKTNNSRARITQKYLIEMEQVAKELSRIIAPSGRIIFILGNNQVCGETLRNDEFMTYCFKKYGLNLKLILVDDIKSRGLMIKRNRTASIISRETVLIFEKPT